VNKKRKRLPSLFIHSEMMRCVFAMEKLFDRDVVLDNLSLDAMIHGLFTERCLQNSIGWDVS
jgi:hypothetical protein